MQAIILGFRSPLMLNLPVRPKETQVACVCSAFLGGLDTATDRRNTDSAMGTSP